MKTLPILSSPIAARVMLATILVTMIAALGCQSTQTEGANLADADAEAIRESVAANVRMALA